jgi:UDP-N-acetylmuramoyl-L-alanyl-D-glutamate--2,6-diaminopimelate ligase
MTSIQAVLDALTVSGAAPLLIGSSGLIGSSELIEKGSSTPLRGATHDSRQVRAGSLFCCVPGDKMDGHSFAQDAVDAGAAALVVQHPVATDPSVPQIQVADVRAVMGVAAAAAFDNPAEKLVMVGVTGTNGKTSTAHMLTEILRAAGLRAEVIGTLTQTRTTPEATDLHEQLAAYVSQGVTHVVMEVTSHALVLHRVAGVRFRIAVFTNLSQDHLDFHQTMEAYFRAKATLFTPIFTDQAIVNGDDPYGHLLAEAATVPTSEFSFAQITDLDVGVTSSFSLNGHHVELAVGGRFSVSNALAAAATASALGISDDAIVQGLGAVHVPGRFESVDAGQPFTVVVDYAHTPDGLQRVLESARGIVGPDGRLVTVFGCGGDRDRTKRPLMGHIAASLSDIAILTSDNPRSEDPAAIANDVVEGIAESDLLHLTVELDRAAAIAGALTGRHRDDVVLIAGKGHEQGQDINGVVRPFDDRDVAAQVLLSLAGK